MTLDLTVLQHSSRDMAWHRSFGAFVFVVSTFPVMPLFVCILAHPSILLMFGIVLCKCSGNVLSGYVIFKIK